MDPNDNTTYVWWEWVLLFMVGITGLVVMACGGAYRRLVHWLFEDSTSAGYCYVLTVLAAFSLFCWLWRALW